MARKDPRLSSLLWCPHLINWSVVEGDGWIPQTPLSWKHRLSCIATLTTSFFSCAVWLIRISWWLPFGCPPSCFRGASLTASQNGSLGRVLTLILFTPQLGQASSPSSFLQSSRYWACTSSRTCWMRRSYSCRPAFAHLFFSASIRCTALCIYFFLLCSTP